jgi:ABC-type ATPase involved in cell division
MIELVDVRLDHPRGSEPLVEGANLKVATGDVVMIVGAAGVGTSRLVAAALGEVPVNGGRIEVMGRDVAKLRRSSLRLLRRRIGIVPQDLCLLEDRSAQLNVVLPLEIDGIPRSMSIARSDEILEKLHLSSVAQLPIDSLSAAERQRVAVARALVRNPEMVIADHPTSAQDPDGAELVCSTLAEAAATGAAVIVLGKDPVLRAIAERRKWHTLALLDRKLRTLQEIGLAGAVIDELLVGSEPVPAEAPEANTDEIPNVVPFPLSARTAGVA